MKHFKLWVGIAMLAALVLGVTLGNYVLAGGSGRTPGSADDPLVSESYIVELVEEKTATLEYKIFEMEQEITSLTQAISALEGQLVKGSSKSSSGSSAAPAQPTQPSAPATPKAPSQPPADKEEAPAAEKSSTKTVNSASGINVRSGPGTSYDVVASLNDGAKVSVAAEVDGWFEVELEDGQTGWIYGDLLK